MTPIRKFYKVYMLSVVMRKELLLFLGVFLVGLMGPVGAVSSSTWVDFSVGVDEYSYDGKVSGLEIEDKGKTWFYLVWGNSEEDFSHNLIFVDGDLVGETSGEFFRVSGLDKDNRYKIEVVPVNDDEEGRRSSVSGRTLGSNGGDDDEIESDVVPNFYIGEDEVALGNSSIVLGDFTAVEGEGNFWILFWIVVALLFLILLLFVLVSLIRD